MRWLSQLTAADLTGLLSRMHLREKLIQTVWMQHQLTPSDLLRLSHAVPLSPTWWQHYLHPSYHHLLLPNQPHPFERRECGTGSGDDSSGGSDCGGGGGGGYSRAKRGGVGRLRRPCDGTACFGFCGFLDSLIEAAMCHISWNHSPLSPLPDQPNAPNQPFIAIRRLQDDSLTRRQEELVDALCLQLVVDTPSVRSRDDSRPGEAAVSAATQSVESVEVAMSVVCNSAFERLLGFTQSEVRELWSSDGDKALYGLIAEDDWAALLQVDKEVRLGWRREGCLLVSALDRRRERVRCVLQVQSELDVKGKPLVTYLSFTPLPAAAVDVDEISCGSVVQR